MATLFVQEYLERLRLWSGAPPPPTISTLRQIQRAHLEHVPFENLEQHRAGGRVSLALEDLVEKVIRRRRGGFCFELNGLLAELLEALGFFVRRVPAVVFAGAAGWRGVPTHIFLLVAEPPNGAPAGEDSERLWFADVSFGEPPLEPLRLWLDGREQTTAEGMISRFVIDDHPEEATSPTKSELDLPKDSALVVLEWNTDGAWKPRIRFSLSDVTASDRGPCLEDFQRNCDEVLREGPFTQKLIMCTLTETEKRTLAGATFKVTKPRFGGEQVITELAEPSAEPKTVVEAAQQVMLENFGISLEESKDLDLTISLHGRNVATWDHLL